MQKTITFGIPCYNSAEYMDHCISSILQGTGYAQDVQIVVVCPGRCWPVMSVNSVMRVKSSVVV